MKKHLFTTLIGATSMVASSPVRAQNIVATHDAYGHTVWVASDEAKPQPKPQTPVPQTVVPQTIVPRTQEPQQTGNVTPAQTASNETTPPRYHALVSRITQNHLSKPP